MHYLFYAKTVTSPTFTKGLLEVSGINSHCLTGWSSLLITAEIKSWDISGGLKQKIPFVPWFLLQDLRCQPETTHRGPCPGSKRQLLNVSMFSVASSQNNQRVQTWKHISSLHPCQGSGWVKSVILNLVSSSPSPAWVSSTGMGECSSLQRKENWAKSEHSQPLELFSPWHWTTAGPKSSISCSVTLPSSAEVAFSCNFPLWLKVFICAGVWGVSYSANTEIQT